MQNRTRKEAKNVHNFLREAGLEDELPSEISDQRKSNGPPISKKDKYILSKVSYESSTNLSLIKKMVDRPENDRTLLDLNSKQKIEQQKIQENIPLQNIKLIFKQSIRGSQINKIKGEKIIQGCIGHSTVVFRRPIVQGSYYLQFKILDSTPIDPKNQPKYRADYRMGICAPNYKIDTPLGQKTSIGFKINDAQIVSNSKLVKKSESSSSGAKIGDIFGMAINFSPPYKYQTKQNIWNGSSLIFFKNGTKICEYDQIFQDYYCPAFSLYNYASMEVRINRSEFEYLPEKYTPYAQIFGENIPYENLRNEPIFNQFFQSKSGGIS